MEKKNLSILLIEDNPGDARLIKEMLTEASGVNMKLKLAKSLSSGLQEIEVAEFDLILLDLSLPDSSGLETFAGLQAMAKDAPIIVLSGLDDEEIAMAAVKKGAQDYLVKGRVDSDLLVRAISYATERKRVERELRVSEKRFRDLVEMLPQTVFEIDVKGNILFSNRRGFDLFGYTENDIISGVNALQLFVPEDRERVKENIQKKLREEEFGENEYLALSKEKTAIPVLVYSTPIVLDGKPVGLRGIVLDITERKRAEEAIRKSEEKYRTLVDFASDFVFLIDENDRILSLNRAAAELFRQSPDDLTGKSIFDIFPKNIADGYSEALRNIFETGMAQSSEVKMVIGEKETWISSRLNPVRDHDGNIIAVQGVARDISERKSDETALKEKTEKLARFARLSVGREKRMMELKKKITELESLVKIHKGRGAGD
jgi:PAS domain S-box-containing protein